MSLAPQFAQASIRLALLLSMLVQSQGDTFSIINMLVAGVMELASGSGAYLWSRSANEGLNIISGYATLDSNYRALGFSVRCIAEEVHYSLF
jgi:hypothetical protein